jgi:hypothetical protein
MITAIVVIGAFVVGAVVGWYAAVKMVAHAIAHGHKFLDTTIDDARKLRGYKGAA